MFFPSDLEDVDDLEEVFIWLIQDNGHNRASSRQLRVRDLCCNAAAKYVDLTNYMTVVLTTSWTPKGAQEGTLATVVAGTEPQDRRATPRVKLRGLWVDDQVLEVDVPTAYTGYGLCDEVARRMHANGTYMRVFRFVTTPTTVEAAKGAEMVEVGGEKRLADEFVSPCASPDALHFRVFDHADAPGESKRTLRGLCGDRVVSFAVPGKYATLALMRRRQGRAPLSAGGRADDGGGSQVRRRRCDPQPKLCGLPV